MCARQTDTNKLISNAEWHHSHTGNTWNNPTNNTDRTYKTLMGFNMTETYQHICTNTS